MATTRTVTKKLGGQEDLLWGKGVQNQSRGGQIVPVTKIDKIHPVDTIANLRDDSVDPSQFAKVQILGLQLVNDGGANLYYWDEADTMSADDGENIIISGYPGSAGRWKRVVPNISEWILFTGTPVFSTATSFKASGDHTNIFSKARRLLIDDVSTILGYVTSSTYNATLNETTVNVNVGTSELTPALTTVHYSLVTTDSIPASVTYTEVNEAYYVIDADALISGNNIFGIKPSGIVEVVLPATIPSDIIITISDESGNVNLQNLILTKATV